MLDLARYLKGKARQILHEWGLVGRSAYMLAALLALLFGYPFFLDNSLQHRLILGSINVLILVTASYAATKTWRAFLAVVVFLGVPAFGLQVVYLLTGNAIVGDLFFISYGIFYVYTIAHMLNYVLEAGAVTSDKICAAISVYILIGLLWASAYVLIDHLHPGSFAYNGTSSPTNPLEPMKLLYFSFITLTTTGYGDIVPVTPRAQSLAILEQLAATFYLAILIARLTGLYRGPGNRGSDQD